MKKMASVLLILIIIFGLFGCEKDDDNKFTKEIFSLDTVITLTAYGNDAQNAVCAAENKIYYYNDLFSVTKEGSDIYKINNSDSDSVRVDAETSELISKSLKISESTDGAFDISVFPLVKLWGFTTGDYKVPDNKSIEKQLKNVGYKNVLADGNLVSKKRGTQIDLGGIAKGYISDKICELMKSYDVSGGIVSLGGNVETFGKKDGGETFTVGVEYPESGDCYATLELCDKVCVTSGAYQRNFTENGKLYHHIIDPKSGYPAESDILSVTVISDDGALADAMSTALFVMGADKAVEFLKNAQNISAVILTDGKVYVSKDIENRFDLETSYEHLEVKPI